MRSAVLCSIVQFSAVPLITICLTQPQSRITIPRIPRCPSLHPPFLSLTLCSTISHTPRVTCVWHYTVVHHHIAPLPVIYCTVKYCTIMCCAVLCYTVSYCTVLHCIVLYCTTLHVSYCTPLYCTSLYCTSLYGTILPSHTLPPFLV